MTLFPRVFYLDTLPEVDEHEACLMVEPIDVEGFNSNTGDKSISLGSDEDVYEIEPLILSAVVQGKCKQQLSKPDCHHEGKWVPKVKSFPECVEEATWSWSNPLSTTKKPCLGSVGVELG